MLQPEWSLHPLLPCDLRPRQRTAEVHLDGLVPRRERRVDQRPGVRVRRRVVDQHVAAAVALDALGDDPLAVLRLGRCARRSTRRSGPARRRRLSSTSALRAVISTFAPASANALAMPLPMPFEPPVTTAALPSMRSSMPSTVAPAGSVLRRERRLGARQVRQEPGRDALVVVMDERGTEEPVGPLLGQQAGLGEDDRHRPGTAPPLRRGLRRSPRVARAPA